MVCGEALAGISASEESFDAWFLDGFAPARNPDMWSLEIMQALFAKTAPGGTFATYAAAGFVRRNLIAAGFEPGTPERFCRKAGNALRDQTLRLTRSTAMFRSKSHTPGTSRRGMFSPSHCAILSSSVSGLMGFDR